MAIPTYEEVMVPLLRALSGHGQRHIKDVRIELESTLGLTPDEVSERLPSGQQTIFSNRVGWAKTHLKKAGLIGQQKRGWVELTDEGRRLLDSGVESIDRKFLMTHYPDLAEFVEESIMNSRSRGGDGSTRDNTTAEPDAAETPEAAIENAHATLEQALADEVLTTVKECSPEFFERLVVELLVAMGYGGSIRDAGKAVGRRGDGGIDGVIKEDKLGLDVVVVQAKRFLESTVGRPAVQGFAGSMEPYRARKGVMITTSSFSAEAKEYVDKIERKIVLIDGTRLAKLMIEHGIGVTAYRTYVLKRLDSDYFEE